MHKHMRLLRYLGILACCYHLQQSPYVLKWVLARNDVGPVSFWYCWTASGTISFESGRMALFRGTWHFFFFIPFIPHTAAGVSPSLSTLLSIEALGTEGATMQERPECKFLQGLPPWIFFFGWVEDVDL